MIKWKRDFAGSYTSHCGRFNIQRYESDLLGWNHVWWNLHCSDPNVTLDERRMGVVDSRNTKWECQELAQNIIEQVEMSLS